MRLDPRSGCKGGHSGKRTSPGVLRVPVLADPLTDAESRTGRASGKEEPASFPTATANEL